MVLSILIPTFNRVENLIFNLNSLKDCIISLNAISDIEIVVSNNSSTDLTDELVNKFKEDNKIINLDYYKQESNIGLEKNAIFVLGKAKADFIMFLGDDDYLCQDYLWHVLKEIDENNKLTVIIPSFVAIKPNGDIIENSGRDLGLKKSIHLSGFKNCYSNSWRAHQMSGLVLKREDLYEAYIYNKVENIYPFIFLVTYNALRGSTIHLPEFPIKVTQVSQDKKDWNYGKDGLLGEVYDNYDKIKLNIFYKTRLQLKFFSEQTWRLSMYVGSGKFIKAFVSIWFSKNSTLIYKFIFPFFIVVIYFKSRIKRVNLRK